LVGDELDKFDGMKDKCIGILDSCCPVYLLPFEGLTEVSNDNSRYMDVQDVVLIPE